MTDLLAVLIGIALGYVICWFAVEIRKRIEINKRIKEMEFRESVQRIIAQERVNIAQAPMSKEYQEWVDAQRAAQQQDRRFL